MRELVAAAWLCWSASGCSPRPPAAPSSEPALRRGINLGNALDAPVEGAWGVTLDEAHFQLAATLGFDHVRLPVSFAAHAARDGGHALDEALLRRVDWALDRAHAHGLGVVLDWHHDDALIRDPDANEARFLSGWEQLARRYAARPDSVRFELLNEPRERLTASRWNALAARAVTVVRAADPDRTIVVDAGDWASARALAELELPRGARRVVASFHMYSPLLFTHQGARWLGPEYDVRGVVFPGPPSRAATRASVSLPWIEEWLRRHDTEPAATNPSSQSAIDEELDRAAEFASRTGATVYMGEFGAIDAADPASRERWLVAVREGAERRGFAWAYWDNGGEFALLRPRERGWVEGVRRAVAPR